MNAISRSSSRCMRSKRLRRAFNKPTSIPTERWIVYVSTNVGSIPRARRDFMWATCLHGFWITGIEWDGMRHSIPGKTLFETNKPVSARRVSKTSPRWHGDPNVRRPPALPRPMRPPTLPLQHTQASEPPQEPTLPTEDSPVLDRATADPTVTHFERIPYDLQYPSAPDPGEAILSPPQTPSTVPVGQHHLEPYAPSTTPFAIATEQPPAQTLVTACMRLLQAQADDSKMRLEYMQRREEREEADSRMRMEMEKKRQEREAADSERLQQNAKMKQKSELATELLSNPNVDPSVKAAAGDYLKKLFAND